MTYEEALRKIHSLDKFGSMPGLQRVEKLFDLVGEGLREQKFIHIAGTNGKGSTAQIISSTLTQCGYKTGLFISPYIVKFNERIQINGKMIKDEELADAVSYLSPFLDKLNEEGVIITEFEFLTVLAFYVFKKTDCDFIVCETGLGGLLDSTNVIRNPLCSVITRIDFDHTEILGSTIKEIATQKCGIIKENGITVSAFQRDEALSIIQNTAKEKNNEFYYAEDIEISDISFDIDGTYFTYNGNKLHLNMLGVHQLENLKTALLTLEVLNKKSIAYITPKSISDGVSKASNPARFEVLFKSPIIALDGAHNPSGMKTFVNAVKKYSDNHRVLILGMLKDKDTDTCVSLVSSLFDEIYTVDIDNPRSESAKVLAQKCSLKCENVYDIGDIKEAFDICFSKNCDIYITGSLYLCGEIRQYIIDKLSQK